MGDGHADGHVDSDPDPNADGDTDRDADRNSNRSADGDAHPPLTVLSEIVTPNPSPNVSVLPAASAEGVGRWAPPPHARGPRPGGRRRLVRLG